MTIYLKTFINALRKSNLKTAAFSEDVGRRQDHNEVHGSVSNLRVWKNSLHKVATCIGAPNKKKEKKVGEEHLLHVLNYKIKNSQSCQKHNDILKKSLPPSRPQQPNQKCTKSIERATLSRGSATISQIVGRSAETQFPTDMQCKWRKSMLPWSVCTVQARHRQY